MFHYCLWKKLHQQTQTPFINKKNKRVFEGLTSQQHFELFVVKLHLFLRHQAALGALTHRVHEAHTRQNDLLTAAFIAETAAATPTVMLQPTNRNKIINKSFT